jgi:hypothetical protein
MRNSCRISVRKLEDEYENSEDIDRNRKISKLNLKKCRRVVQNLPEIRQPL